MIDLITTTQFDIDFADEPIVIFNVGADPYVCYQATACNLIKVGEVELQAVYQTGGYLYNDYNHLDPNFKLSDFGTCDELMTLSDLYETNFDDDDNDKIKKTLSKINKTVPLIDSVKKLFELYVALNDNLPNIYCYIDVDEEKELIEDAKKNQQEERDE